MVLLFYPFTYVGINRLNGFFCYTVIVSYWQNQR